MRQFKSGVCHALFLAAALVLPTTDVRAQWTEQGTALCTAVDSQSDPAITSDGAGGAIIAWWDRRSGDHDIYAQRVDSYGRARWMTDGVRLCTATGAYPAITSDGSGGAIVTWEDYRGGDTDIYAQHVDASGTAQWTMDGVPVCNAIGSQWYPEITSDGEGGAIVIWSDKRDGDWNVYAQRVDASGAVVWTPDGVPVCTASEDQFYPMIVSGDVGGAVIAWQDYRSGSNWDAYAQHIDASGAIRWTTNGVALCTAADDQYHPVIISDGSGGAIVTWYDYRSGTPDIYAQRVNACGAVRWTTDGVPLCIAIGYQSNPNIVSDGAGGGIVTWDDSRGTDSDIYAQRVDASGAVLWAADGVPVCAATGGQYDPLITSDGGGSATVTWLDSRDCNWGIYAQRVDASGTVLWATDGVVLSTGIVPGELWKCAITSDGGGGATVTWRDEGNSDADIYAQRVTRQGYWGYPSPSINSVQDVPGDQGGKVRVSFDSSRLDAWPDLAVSHYSLWRALSPTHALALKNSGIRLDSPSQATTDLVGKAYYCSPTADWELIDTMDAHLWPEYGFTATTLRDSTSVNTGWEHFCVSAHGTDTFDFWNSPPDSGYSVDNLSPSPPAALAAQYIGDSQLYIHWNPNTETDLSHYAVYRGSTPDFVPDETNRIGAVTDSSFTDHDFGYAEYCYKVSAWDTHENESPFALLSPDMITSAPDVGPGYADVLFQNAPNPFVSSTSIAFSIKEEGHVRLRIFDARGRLVRVIVDQVRGQNRYVERWDGRDESGRLLPAGTYFYHLEAPGWGDSKKMTLAR